MILTMILAATSQLLFANDTSRLIGLAFPAILMSALVVQELRPESFGKGLWTLVGLNLLVPTYYVGQEVMIPFIPLPVSLLLGWLGVDAWSLWWT